VLNIQKLSHSFRNGIDETMVLDEIDLHVVKQEVVALLGSSGSGKSTLLNLMAGLMKPTKGTILLAGKAIEQMTENQLAEFRRTNIGFIFQSYELIPHLSVIENVALPLVFQGKKAKERKAQAADILQQVGLGEKLTMFPSQLSGGQQQRVSIARSLVTEPSIVFADEPTGNLDTKTEREIIDLLLDLNQRLGITFVIVTHEHSVAQRAHRIIHLRDGRLASGDEWGGEAG
jgi:putative ABC transport system ATP-binding protein